MQRLNEPDIPNEADLHAFTEGELSAVEEAALLARLAGQAKALRGLELLRADREMLEGVVDPEPPVGLVGDCLAQVERDLLISEDPLAPAIAFTHPRERARLRRFAMAASFVLILGVGGVLIFKNVLMPPRTLNFGDTTASEDVESNGNLATAANGDVAELGNEDDGETPGDVDSTLRANSGATLEDKNILNDDVAADLTAQAGPTRVVVTPGLSDTAPMRVADAEQMQDAAVPALSADAGLMVQLSALDRGSALERLRALVNEREDGTALIYNVPAMDILPAGNGYEFAGDGAEWMAGAGDVNESAVEPGNRIDLPGGGSGDGDEGSAIVSATEYQLALVPLAEQFVYRDGGFEYTLVGTAAQLQGMLQAMNDGADVGRVRIYRQNEDGSTTTTSLQDLLPPARPVGLQWTRALCWWENPGRDLELAERMVESYRGDEPIIRIPLRVVGR